MKYIFHILVLIVISGCSSKSFKLYDGKLLESTEHAVISSNAEGGSDELTGSVLEVNGKQVDSSIPYSYLVMPGEYNLSIKIIADKKFFITYSDSGISKKVAFSNPAFIAVAGHTYIPRIQRDGDVFTVTIVDGGINFPDECLPLYKMDDVPKTWVAAKIKTQTSKCISLVLSLPDAVGVKPQQAESTYDEELLPSQLAKLNDKPSSLQNRIQFPNIDEDITVLLLCNSFLSAKGEFSLDVSCHRDLQTEKSFKDEVIKQTGGLSVESDITEVLVTTGRSSWIESRFERAIVEAVRYSRIDPATLNGKNIEVKINFAVVFQKDNDKEKVTVFMAQILRSGVEDIVNMYLQDDINQ